MTGPVILILVLILAFGLMPSWPYSANFGWAPSGLFGTLLLILLVLFILGRL